MRKLYVNQAMFKLKEQFAVLDEDGQPVYQVVGSFMKIPKHFDILNLEHEVLATITKKTWSWLPTFYLRIGGEEIATIRKKLTLFKSHYELEAADITIDGNFWNLDFTILRHGEPVGHVSHKVLSLADKYELEIDKPADELLVVSLTIAIDYAKQMQQNAANSSH